nr:putative reverse transcriptase domain-containing protein [Tanacetum cinerariifolium]
QGQRRSIHRSRNHSGDNREDRSIKQRLQAARDLQKSYANDRRMPLEFQVGDKVMLKVSHWKGVVRFGKLGKLNPRYIGPFKGYAQGLTLERVCTIRQVGQVEPEVVRNFKVLANVGKVAYRLELPQELSRVHHTYHVSNLKKCYADEPLAMPLEGIHVDDKL